MSNPLIGTDSFSIPRPLTRLAQDEECRRAGSEVRSRRGLGQMTAISPNFALLDANRPEVARVKKAGSRQRNMLWIISLFIAATKTCPIRSTMFRFRDVASRASTAIAGEGSGISEVFSLPWHRIVIAN